MSLAFPCDDDADDDVVDLSPYSVSSSHFDMTGFDVVVTFVSVYLI